MRLDDPRWFLPEPDSFYEFWNNWWSHLWALSKNIPIAQKDVAQQEILGALSTLSQQLPQQQETVFSLITSRPPEALFVAISYLQDLFPNATPKHQFNDRDAFVATVIRRSSPSLSRTAEVVGIAMKNPEVMQAVFEPKTVWQQIKNTVSSTVRRLFSLKPATPSSWRDCMTPDQIVDLLAVQSDWKTLENLITPPSRWQFFKDSPVKNFEGEHWVKLIAKSSCSEQITQMLVKHILITRKIDNYISSLEDVSFLFPESGSGEKVRNRLLRLVNTPAACANLENDNMNNSNILSIDADDLDYSTDGTSDGFRVMNTATTSRNPAAKTIFDVIEEYKSFPTLPEQRAVSVDESFSETEADDVTDFKLVLSPIRAPEPKKSLESLTLSKEDSIEVPSLIGKDFSTPSDARKLLEDEVSSEKRKVLRTRVFSPVEIQDVRTASPASLIGVGQVNGVLNPAEPAPAAERGTIQLGSPLIKKESVRALSTGGKRKLIDSDSAFFQNIHSESRPPKRRLFFDTALSCESLKGKAENRGGFTSPRFMFAKKPVQIGKNTSPAVDCSH